jgi:hypothetical protein
MSVSSSSPWPHDNSAATGRPTFQARRPFSSSELLALQRKKIEQTLNAPPVNTVNLQTSSEQTARVRKLASRDADPLFKLGRPLVTPETNPVMKGGGTVPNRTSANVTARVAGNAYAADFFNYTPVPKLRSEGCSNLLTDNVTFPKAIQCALPVLRPAYHVVQPYNQVNRFAQRQNDNNVVVAAKTAAADGRCGLTTIY